MRVRDGGMKGWRDGGRKEKREKGKEGGNVKGDGWRKGGRKERRVEAGVNHRHTAVYTPHKLVTIYKAHHDWHSLLLETEKV